MTLAAGICSLALCYAGLSGVCLAMDRHYRQVCQRPPSSMRMQALRFGGWLLLALSLLACMRSIGASAGAVLWFGVLSICTAAIVVMLAYAPSAVARCALIAAPIGAFALLAL
jgi:hypothetical protein